MKTILSSILLFILAISAPAADLVINEVQYSNHETLRDAGDETPDWLEIYNHSELPVDLEGWSLTDDTAKTVYWKFEARLLQPGEFLIVYLSGNEGHHEGEIHAGFKLASGKEGVYLINPRGMIADEHPAICVPTDLTSGRIPDGAGPWVIQQATPGTSNNHSQQVPINVLPDSLWLSHPSGFYDEGLKLEIHHLHSSNQVYYTLDGSDPDEHSLLYTGSLSLHTLNNHEDQISMISTSDVWIEPGEIPMRHPVVRARVLSGGCPASKVATASYFLEGLHPDKYEVPVVSLVTDPDNLFDDDEGIYVSGNHSNYNQRGKKWERPVHLDMFQPGGKKILEAEAGMRIHGAGSRGAPQKSIRLYAREEYGNRSFNYPFFKDKPDLDGFRTLLLRSVRDWSGTLFKEELTHHLVRDMEMDYMAGQTVIVFINGEYWGIHSLRERQDVDYLRMNHHLYEADFDVISHKLGAGLVVEEGNELAYHELLAVLETENLEGIHGFARICELVDINSISDYYIAELFYANGDFPHNNYKMWKAREYGEKWKWMFYDCDACMIRTNYDHFSEYFSPAESFEVHEDWTLFVLRKLMENDHFRNHFRQRFYYHLSNTFEPSKVIDEINQFEMMYRPLMAEHIQRWNQPNELIKWQHNVDKLRIFALQRPAELSRQIEKNLGEPLLISPNPTAGEVRISNPFTAEKPLGVTIHSVSGSRVLETVLNNNSDSELWLQTGLPSGMYFLTVSDGFFSFTNKLIVN